MKIVHLCLASFYIDGYSYQENELPKYHRAAGHEVEIIASRVSFDADGHICEYQGESRYLNENGIPVTRLDYQSPARIYSVLRRYRGLYDVLERFAPELLFIHGCQFMDIDVAVRYVKKHPDTRVVVDNHADLCNSATNFLSMNVLHKIIWKRCARKAEPVTARFYGVTPSRVDFLKDIYGLPAEKCSLLVMGADDEAVENASRPEVRQRRRIGYGVADDDIVIVTGGKIDHNKPQVLKLMQAVNQLKDDRIRLIVFGSVVDELKEAFRRNIGDHVKYIGWRKSEEIYEDFAAADIVAFPGLHSVLWEQAAGMGKPCLFKRIKGFEHVDLGGNCLFFENDDSDEYLRVIQNAAQRLDAMKAAARQGSGVFSYRAIAEKSLEGSICRQ